MLFCSMFGIEHDSFNSYSCSALLTEVKNPLYMLARIDMVYIFLMLAYLL